MRIVDAEWEKRNLGIDVTEITCFEKDSAAQLSDILRTVETPYSVLKIPSGCINLLLVAQKEGYSFIETDFELWGDLYRVSTPEYYKRFEKHIRMEEASGKILERVLNEIQTGTIFETDRIALDPHFSKRIAGERYYNWTQDILSNDAFMGVLYYKDTPVAFNLSKPAKDRDDAYDGVLGGLLPEASEKGLGFLVVYGENQICKLNGRRYCIGRVSSNNMPILRLHLQFGYEVKSIVYVLIKHQ